jgi:hypothetical protein
MPQGTKGEGGHSAIVLLTDGRVDGYQVRKPSYHLPFS